MLSFPPLLPCSSWFAPGIQTAPSGGRFPLLHQRGNRTYTSQTLFTERCTFPILLTYRPRYLRLTVSLASLSSSSLFPFSPEFSFTHNLFAPSPELCHPATLQHFFHLVFYLYFYSIFSHFLTLPSTPFIVFIFLRISHASYFSKSSNLGDLLSFFHSLSRKRRKR